MTWFTKQTQSTQPLESREYRAVNADIVKIEKKLSSLEIEQEALKISLQKLSGRFFKHMGDEDSEDKEEKKGKRFKDFGGGKFL